MDQSRKCAEFGRDRAGQLVVKYITIAGGEAERRWIRGARRSRSAVSGQQCGSRTLTAERWARAARRQGARARRTLGCPRYTRQMTGDPMGIIRSIRTHSRGEGAERGSRAAYIRFNHVSTPSSGGIEPTSRLFCKFLRTRRRQQRVGARAREMQDVREAGHAARRSRRPRLEETACALHVQYRELRQLAHRARDGARESGTPKVPARRRAREVRALATRYSSVADERAAPIALLRAAPQRTVACKRSESYGS